MIFISKKILIGIFTITLFLVTAAATTYAEETEDTDPTVLEMLMEQVEDLWDRVLRLEDAVKELKRPNYYTKRIGPTVVEQGMVHDEIYSCDMGDEALGAGLSAFSGELENWRTLRSAPLPAKEEWEVAVVNEMSEGTFNVAIKCLDL